MMFGTAGGRICVAGMAMAAFAMVSSPALARGPLHPWICKNFKGPFNAFAAAASFPLEKLPKAEPGFGFPLTIGAGGADYLFIYAEKPEQAGVMNLMSIGAYSVRSDRKPIDPAVTARIAATMKAQIGDWGTPKPLPHLYRGPNGAQGEGLEIKRQDGRYFEI